MSIYRPPVSLSAKSLSILKNVLELSKLEHVLLAYDAVTFYSYVTCLVYNEHSDNYFRRDVFNKLDRLLDITPKMKVLEGYNMIRRCFDQGVKGKVDKLYTLAKRGAYHIVRKKEEEKRNKITNKYNAFWSSFKDKAGKDIQL